MLQVCIAADILGVDVVPSPRFAVEAVELGIAWGLIGLIRALPNLIKQGRFPLPASLIAPEEYLNEFNNDMVHAIQSVCAIAKDYLDRAMDRNISVSKVHRSVFLSSILAINFGTPRFTFSRNLAHSNVTALLSETLYRLKKYMEVRLNYLVLDLCVYDLKYHSVNHDKDKTNHCIHLLYL